MPGGGGDFTTVLQGRLSDNQATIQAEEIGGWYRPYNIGLFSCFGKKNIGLNLSEGMLVCPPKIRNINLLNNGISMLNHTHQLLYISMDLCRNAVF